MADVEAALMVLLDDFGYTGTSDPPDLEAVIAEHGAAIRIARVGGPGNRDDDFPRVAIQVKAPTAAGATARAHVDLALAVDDFLFAKIPGAWVDGLTFDAISRDSGPITRNDNPSTAYRVAESIYSLTTRR